MGCGCNKRRKTLTAASNSFKLTMPNGETFQASTRLEAEKLNAELGGGGKVKKA